MDMTRKDFLKGGLALAGALVGLRATVGCGGGGGGAQDMGLGVSCVNNGTSAVIASNHGHTLNVPKADVMAGVEKTYDITGGAPHGHMVTLTAADFAMLKQNAPVAVMSTSTVHTHLVTVSCV